MRVLCPTCESLNDYSVVRLSGNVLVVTCDACQEEGRIRVVVEPELKAANASGTRVSASRPALSLVRGPGQLSAAQVGSRGDLSVPAGYCPKCVAPRAAKLRACVHCGLLEGNFNPQSFEMSATLKRVWRDVLASYENPRLHERFVRTAANTGELALAGRVYRIRLAREPGDRLAHHGRSEVLRLASVVQTAPQRQAPLPPYKRASRNLFLLLAPVPAVLVLLWSVLSRLKH